MAVYPPRGTEPWDTPLLAYLDDREDTLAAALAVAQADATDGLVADEVNDVASETRVALNAVIAALIAPTLPKVAWYAPAVAATAAIPGASTEINAALRLSGVVVPASGYVLVASEVHAAITTAGVYYHEFRTSAGTVIAKTRQAATSVSDMPRHVEARLGPYTPGTVLDIRLHHYVASGVGSTTLHESVGKQAMLRATPVAA